MLKYQNNETLVQIRSPNFCAGIVLIDDKVRCTAPILHYMGGWNADGVRAYVKKRQWKAIIVYGPLASTGRAPDS